MDDNRVNQEAFRYTLEQIKDGNVFEKFGQDLLSKILTYEFIPAGGIRDRGIDGFEYTYNRRGLERSIYQLSIEKDYKGKIKDSLEKLKTYKVVFDQFTYVTNILVKDKDRLMDGFVEKYKKAIVIYDQQWLVSHINDSPATMESFQIFVDSYLHQFNKPGQSYVVANLEDDPRLYVFLRQQLDSREGDYKLTEILVDTLILYALEDTDPDKNIFKTEGEIIKIIREKVKFDPRIINDYLQVRLKKLSSKPRRIHYYKEGNEYCLDYSERLEIKNRNLNDLATYEGFQTDTKDAIDKYVTDDVITNEECLKLVEDLLNYIFYKQGIEFSDFVLHGSSKDLFEKSLPEIVAEVVDRSKLKMEDRQGVKSSLLTVIRAMVYSGSQNQKVFLKRLSNTYMMLFLLQCDPKLCTYFSTLASKLKVYVCSSIIIPALAEIFLSEESRRYTNLLKGAKEYGVQLIINEAILGEIAAHFRMIKAIYDSEYKNNDEVYTDQFSVRYVPEIMIRAYYYARTEGAVNTFEEFLNKFISTSMRMLNENIIEWVRREYGIEYIANSSLGIRLDQTKINVIVGELTKWKKQTRGKGAAEKAKTDANVMMTIHELRDIGNESGKVGTFGYRTWWLTSDITTQKAAEIAAGGKYTTSCYMRPDFLFNYITLAPKRKQVDEAFAGIFPSLLGVNISYNVPVELSKTVHTYIKEHKEQGPARMRGTIREMSDDLKQYPTFQMTERAEAFFSKAKGR